MLEGYLRWQALGRFKAVGDAFDALDGDRDGRVDSIDLCLGLRTAYGMSFVSPHASSPPLTNPPPAPRAPILHPPLDVPSPLRVRTDPPRPSPARAEGSAVSGFRCSGHCPRRPLACSMVPTLG